MEYYQKIKKEFINNNTNKEVKEYSSKVMGLIEKNITKAQCVKKLNSTHNSIEEIIIEELYDWREE